MVNNIALVPTEHFEVPIWNLKADVPGREKKII